MYEYVGVYNKCLQVNNIKMSDTIYKDSKAFSKKITYQYMKPIKKIQLFMYLHFRKIYNLLLKALS